MPRKNARHLAPGNTDISAIDFRRLGADGAKYPGTSRTAPLIARHALRSCALTASGARFIAEPLFAGQVWP